MANALGASIPKIKRDQIDPLDRAHYGLRIRKILDHLYETVDLKKRDDPKSDYPCRQSGTPQYDGKGRLSHCVYNTPIEKYNQAIRDLHFKLRRRDLDESGLVYFSNSSSTFHPRPPKRDNAQGRTYADSSDDAFDIEQFTLDWKAEGDSSYDMPANWERKDSDFCYGSGVWVFDVEFATILKPFCSLANVTTAYRSGYVTHATFFYVGNPVDGRQGDETLHAETDNPASGVSVEFDAEIIRPSGWEPPLHAVHACLAATKHFVYYSCQGKHSDQRGGVVTAQYTGYTVKNAALAPQDWGFGLDPNTGDQGEAPSCRPGYNCP
ncbi:hypothetical protein TWF694_006902 [Orbilia ellipsospora]|uniref:Uncharacterized protein n=1 Tax=Orbilia ellipsospora TaxID=2528407 RepID=A0AAV9XP60_9PEZI